LITFYAACWIKNIFSQNLKEWPAGHFIMFKGMLSPKNSNYIDFRDIFTLLSNSENGSWIPPCFLDTCWQEEWNIPRPAHHMNF
jgi:hypothetical protein